MLHTLLRVVVLLSLPAAVLAAGISPVERAQVRAQMLESCESQLTEHAVKAASEPPAVLRWLESAQDGYCACTADRFVATLTPELLRSGTEAEGRAAALAAGNACVVPRLKKTFPVLCGDLVAEMTGRTEFDMPQARTRDAFCGCLQADIDRLEPDTLEPFVKATVEHYVEYGRTRQLPALGSTSLIASMQACGFDELKARIDSAR